MPSFELIVFAIAVIVWLFKAVGNGVKRLNAQGKGTNAPPSLVQQAITDAQRLQATPPARPGGPPAFPQAAPRRVPPQFGQPSGAAPPRPARQPPAGGPAVSGEATSADFALRERTIQADEPAGLGVALTSDTPGALSGRRAGPLFGDTDDLVRAIILQEVLGPPLSRRHTNPPLPPA